MECPEKPLQVAQTFGGLRDAGLACLLLWLHRGKARLVLRLGMNNPYEMLAAACESAGKGAAQGGRVRCGWCNAWSGGYLGQGGLGSSRC